MPCSAGSGKIEFPGNPAREAEVLRRSLDGLKGDLPDGWDFQIEEAARRGGVRFDAIVTIEAPDGQRAILVAEAKRLVDTRDVAPLLEQLRSNARAAKLKNATPLVVARYFSPATRERLEQSAVAYADATGNRRLALERPALFVRNVGEDRDPWRGPGRPRGTLKGPAAARVVRWLVDFSPPYTVPEVAEGSGASTGATYRVVTFLEQEQLLEREPRGAISVVRWRPLIERWSRDFVFQRGEAVESLLFPRGLDALVDLLRSTKDLPYVLTGSLAARHFAPYAPARFAMLYADDIGGTIERLGLRRVDTGANALIAADRDNIGFVRARELDGVNIAAPSQIAVDLLTGPGRSPSEGEALSDWMEANEREWRTGPAG